MPSPRKCRYGKDCHFGPELCRFSHSCLEEGQEVVRQGQEIHSAFEQLDDSLHVVGADDEGYGTDASAETSPRVKCGKEFPCANIPSLQSTVLRWFETYYALPVNAMSIVQTASTLATIPFDLQKAVCQRLSYLPLRALQRTKWFSKDISKKEICDSTKTTAFQIEAQALLSAVDQKQVGSFAGSDVEWAAFRAKAICAPTTVQTFRGLYRRRLSIMQQTINSSSKRDYFYSLKNFLEELRQEAELATWPSWQLSRACPSPDESILQAQDRILRVWMEKLRAALTDI